jgi:RimJ/RimL family protein N-acetyltransferase
MTAAQAYDPTPESPARRLRLRPLRLEDAGWIARETARPEIHRMIARAPARQSVLDAELFILSMRAREHAAGDRVRVAERLEDGAPLGLVGVHPHRDGASWELGYWFARAAWGAGYATEAAQAMVVACEADGLTPLVAGHYVDNPASRRVLEKIGFEPTGETREQFSLGRMAKAPSRRMARPAPAAL